jgi:uncharacterized membrane protein
MYILHLVTGKPSMIVGLSTLLTLSLFCIVIKKMTKYTYVITRKIQ